MLTTSANVDAPVRELLVSAYSIPTESAESDGTLEWEATTMVCVQIKAGDETGFGYTYGDASIAILIRNTLAPMILGESAMAVPRLWEKLFSQIRNNGQCGLAMMAISAIDAALWDLKGKLLELPVVALLGRERDAVDLYGSGGFTSYSDQQMERQLTRWTQEEGMSAVKIKVGRDPKADPSRVAGARDAIGDHAALFVDANSAYSRKQALRWMHRFANEYEVSWMEEPIDPNDLEGLRLLRDNAPHGMDLAEGEYGWTVNDFRRFAEAGAVDVMMPDMTRCGGITGLLEVAALCRAHNLPISTHCAPTLHLHPGCALRGLRHCEYFHDHARIEEMLLEGFQAPVDGTLRPDLSRPGLGVELKEKDAAKFAV